VADDEQPVRVGAELGRVGDGPGDSVRVVVEEIGEGDLGIQPVVRDHDHRAACRERDGHKGIAATVAGAPASAIEEHDERARPGGIVVPIHVELPPRPIAVGDAVVDGDALRRDGRIQEGSRGAARENGGAKR